MSIRVTVSRLKAERIGKGKTAAIIEAAELDVSL